VITNSASGMWEASSHRSVVVKSPSVSRPIIKARGGLTGVEVVDVVESEVGMTGMRSRAKSRLCILCVLWT